MAKRADQFFGQAVQCFSLNAKNACDLAGIVNEPTLFNLSVGLEAFLRGVVIRLNAIDDQLDSLEQALGNQKSLKDKSDKEKKSLP